MKKLHLFKRTLLLLALIVGCVSYGWAESKTFTFNTVAGLEELGITPPSKGTGTELGNSEYTLSPITMTATNGGSTATRIWNSSGSYTLRVYGSASKKGTLTFSTTSSYNITAVSIGVGTWSASTGTMSGNSWSGSAQSVTFSTSANATISTITVTYSSSGPQDVTLSFAQTNPSITLTKDDGFYDGTFTQTVSKSPAAYSGTITYSITSLTGFTADEAEVNSSGEVTILSEENKSGTIVVKAEGTEVDGKYNKPEDVTYTLTVNAYKPATPTFSTEGGAVDYGTELALTSGVTIKYTTDGETTPTASVGSTYEGPIAIKDAMTVKAVAVDGSAVSDVASFDFTINTPAAVTFSTPGSTDSKNPEAVPYGTEVKLTHGMVPSLGSIVYTTNNRNPGKTSEAVVGQQTYSEPITITKNTTLKACFLSDNDLYLGSYDAQYYSIANPDAPTFSVAAGYVAKDTEVELSKSTPYGVIKYTTDGTEPSAENGTEYSDAIVISTGMTIKAIVIISDANGTYTSDVASAQYKVTGEPETLPYEESFATDFGGFTTDGAEISTTGVKIWRMYAGDNAVLASSYTNETDYDGESWMYSPVIDLTSVKGAELTFEQYLNYFGDKENQATLWAKAVDGDWAKLALTYPSSTDFEEVTINLSAYAGKQMQFAFKYIGDKDDTNGCGEWEIKNLSVTQIKGNANLAISGTPSATMDVTTTQTLTTTSDSDGAITFSSSDASIATVNATTGEVTAVSPGDVTITVSQAEASEYKADEVEFNITVTVKPAVNPAGSEVTGNFEKVTDAAKLAEGNKVIIVYETDKVAMSTTQNENNRGEVDVTISGSTIEPVSNLQVVTLEDAGDSKWYLNVGDDAYLCAGSSSKNYLWTREKDEAGDNGKATISITDGNAAITFQGSNERNILKYNSGSSIFSCYSSGQQAVQLYRFVPGDDSFNVTIGSTGWKTIVSKYDVSVPNTHKAYIVTSTGERASIEAVTKIKANTPVILKGTAGSTCTLTILNEVVSYPSENLLAISDNTTGNGVYVLANKGNGVGFYKWIGGSLGAGRVYLPAPDAEGREFIGFDFDDETTGIKAFGNGESTIDGYYDLSGRKVAQPAKGLYIVNGRKVVIK